MALSTAAHYKTALFQILSTLPRDIDPGTWIRNGGVAKADADQIISEYNTWRLALPSRIHQTNQKKSKP